MRFRTMIRRNTALMLVLLALVLAAKALVSAGFMLSAGGERFLTVTICADASGMPKLMRIAIPDKESAGVGSSKAADMGQPCAFSGLGHVALGGVDPILLAAAVAFILLAGLTPLQAPPLRAIAFLRPPLRGPPLPGS